MHSDDLKTYKQRMHRAHIERVERAMFEGVEQGHGLGAMTSSAAPEDSEPPSDAYKRIRDLADQLQVRVDDRLGHHRARTGRNPSARSRWLPIVAMWGAF
jgi:hypothetical protein